MAEDNSVRYIPPGSCSWCGHKPHAHACTSKIRTRAPMPHGKEANVPCPCARRKDTP